LANYQCLTIDKTLNLFNATALKLSTATLKMPLTINSSGWMNTVEHVVAISGITMTTITLASYNSP